MESSCRQNVLSLEQHCRTVAKVPVLCNSVFFEEFASLFLKCRCVNCEVSEIATFYLTFPDLKINIREYFWIIVLTNSQRFLSPRASFSASFFCPMISSDHFILFNMRFL